LGNDDPQGGVRRSSRPMRHATYGFLIRSSWARLWCRSAVYASRIVVGNCFPRTTVRAQSPCLMLHGHIHLHGSGAEKMSWRIIQSTVRATPPGALYSFWVTGCSCFFFYT
jgi:hypothetical protein